MNQTSPNQTLHIVAKDVRRFWPEIVISLALLAAFAYVDPHASNIQEPRGASFVLYVVLRPILYALIPISWWILVSRVVHEENLVGDRQFWITRPYRWPSLLAAKLLFLVVFVLLPVALLQAVLLLVSGFDPTHLAPGILFSVALLGISVILPLIALSTITSSFARLTVTMLGIFISALIFVSLLVSGTRNFGITPHAEWPYLFITFCGTAAIILLQYAWRRTLIARVILGATIVVLIVLPIYFSTSLMGLFFLKSAGAPGFGITQRPTQPPWIGAVTNDRSGEVQTVNVPVNISGLAPDSLVDIEAIKVKATTASGLVYSGPWSSLGQTPHQPGPYELVSIGLPKSFFEQVGAVPVTLNLSLGVTLLSPQGTTSVPFPTVKTTFPGVGICTGNRAFFDPNMAYGLSCTSALRTSDYTHLVAGWSDIPCSKPQPPQGQLIPGDSYIGNFDSDPAGIGLSPLVTQPVGFSNGIVVLPNNASRQRYLCAGSPLTLTRYLLSRRFGTRLTIPNLNLAALPSNPLVTPPQAVPGLQDESN